MTIRRDLLLIFGLFAALVLFIIFGPARQPPVPETTPTTHSTADQGAQALYEWVGRMGYTANRLEYQEFDIGEQTAALVILSPSEPIEPEEAQIILDWVDQGGTLILADDTSNLLGSDNALLRAIDVRIDVYTGTTAIERAQPLQPALDQPAVGETIVQAKRYLVPERDDYVALLGSQAYPFLIGMRQGSGYLYLSSSSYPFTNAGLREPENAKLVLNALRRVASDGIIIFDEYHHGYVRPPAPTTVVLGSPWGWAGTYTMLVVALYLILSGRRFGQPIPLREETQRRSSSEYVESMADLLQRGGKREYILRHYYQQFKRRLARPYGISPQLADPAFIAELARVRLIDEPALTAMLARLQASQASEPQFVATIAEADRMLEELRRK
jgi:nucleotide-binding universal stress UspA family protein